MTTTTDGAAPRRSRRWVTAILGVAISLGLLYWVLRNTSFREVYAHLREARPLPLAEAVLIATLTFPIRAIRWNALLRTESGAPLSWSARWHATAMGFMANNTLPFRLGELLRSYAASRLGGVPLTAALSSIAVERALDALTLLGILGVALVRAGLPADTVIAGARLDALAFKAGIACAVIFAGALFVVLFPRPAERVVRTIVPFPVLADRIVSVVEGVRQGFGALRSPLRLVTAVLWSAVLWLVGSASFYVAFAAFGIRVDFAGALLVQSLLAFGVAAPSTPGYFGVFEVVVAASLGLFGVPKELGVAYGITYHITTFLPIVLLGLWSLARTGLHVRDATEARR